MKYLSLLVFVFFFNSGYSQEYSFQLYIKYPCDSISRPSKIIYELLDLKNFETHEIPVDSTQTFTYESIPLPGPGSYRMVSLELSALNNITIIIDKPGLTKYILNLPEINLHTVGLDMFPEYRVCDIICHGYHEDKYNNGNIRIKGYFNNGVPFKLKEYYSNGIIESKLYESLHKTHSVKYDSVGKIRQKYWSRRGGFYLNYRDFGYTTYYTDGNIRIKKSTVDHIERLKIFYPNCNLKIKQTKNKRLEYSENGQLKTAYKWKTVIERNSFGVEKKLFQIFKSTYNENGKLINTEEMTESVSDPQPSIAYTEKDSDYLH